MNRSQIKYEFELIEALVRKFTSESHKVFKEVQLFERYIDLIIIDGENKLYAIEAKISSTSQAFKQANRYKVIADSVFVAIRKNSSNRRAYELSSKTGIGLILIEKENDGNYKIDIVKEPTHVRIKNNSITNYVLGLTTEYA
jgi:hypothetical protein